MLITMAVAIRVSPVNSHYETDFRFFSAVGAEKSKIGFDESPPKADFHQNRFLK